MSIIENALAKFIDERIAAYMQGGQAQPVMPQALPATPPATLPPTRGATPPVSAPPVAPVAMPQIPAAGPPVTAPPAAPTIPSAGPVAAGPPQATAPMVPAAPVAGVPTLADLRALANDLMRTKPEMATAFQNYMASKGVTSLADMQPADYVETAAKFKELLGVA